MTTHIVTWLIIGLMIGFVASIIADATGAKRLRDAILGMAGALIGGLLSRHAAIAATADLHGNILASVGAIFPLAAWHAVASHGPESASHPPEHPPGPRPPPPTLDMGHKPD